MEKININKLGEVVTEYRDDKPYTVIIDPVKACQEIAEKVNEIIEHLTQDNK